ncbi:MAG TPA: hypothetical protein VIH21_02945, partial [Dehalococcoidia bacterium]
MFPAKRLLIASAAALLLASIQSARTVPSVIADPGPSTGVHIALDCDVAAPGIQDLCAYPVGTTNVDVGSTISLPLGGSLVTSTVAFDMLAEQLKFNPPPVVSGPFLDRNPDFNNELATPPNSWGCTLHVPTADEDPDPALALSEALCTTQIAAPYTPLRTDGSHTTLMTTHYNV